MQHMKIGLVKEFDIGILFTDELLVISEYRTLHFLDSDVFVVGSNKDKEKRISKLKINRILSWSVIHLSGRMQRSVF